MTAATLPAPLRRAALELHALPEGDRSWILAALPTAQRSSLEALLLELRDLGIPPEASLVAAAAPRRDADSCLEHMNASRIAALARILAEEPVGVTRALLAMRRWHWRDALLRELDPQRRVELAGAPAPPAPRVQAVLLQALARRLDAQSVLPARSRWARLRARLAQFRSAP